MKETRVAIVTGGSRGIGREIARALGEQGLRVVITGRDGDSLRKAAADLGAGGLTIVPAVMDVRDRPSVEALRGFVEAELGRADVLVNNAGIAIDQWVSALDVGLDVAHDTFETNFFGPLLLCQAFVPMMRKAGYGRVVNVSSQLGSLERMTGRTVAYRASKAALNALTRTLADELKGENVLVNAMCPGWVRTDLGGKDAPRSPEQGAASAVWLATLPDDGPRGGFFQDGKPYPW